MTDGEYLLQVKERLQTLRDEQQRFNDRIVGDIGRMSGLRLGLPLLAGALALGLGLSVGYQIGRR